MIKNKHKQFILFTICFLAFSHLSFAQFKTVEGSKTGVKPEIPQLQWNRTLNPIPPTQHGVKLVPMAIDQINLDALVPSNIKMNEQGAIIWFDENYIKLHGLTRASNKSDITQQIFKSTKLNQSKDALEFVETIHDEISDFDIYHQYHQEVPVYGGELRIHYKNDLTKAINGKLYPEIALDKAEINVSKEAAIASVKQDAIENGSYQEIQNKALINGDQTQAELVIFHQDGKLENAAWAYQISIYFNLHDRWEYFIDATDGSVIEKYPLICTLHDHDHDHETHTEAISVMDGAVTANAVDLYGNTVNINTYEVGTDYYMIDASRSMFNALGSSMPDEPQGVIWTIDAFNTSPQNNNFQYDHVSSSNNNWSGQNTAVSAHFNAGITYEYFVEKFGRNSINGSGGNIISLVNVSDENGNSMENAFWNGAAMFYGNGGSAFEPLAKALDVAGHEMTHGVVQATANLQYVSQSGALNESFADIFGAMIDGGDWLIGEDVVNPSVFPSGALRSLQDPNQGLTGPQDLSKGWQPKNMDQYLQLENTADEDFGGVHINSGIPNHSFYLLAIEIGITKAEQIYYRALTNYLTKSSQFIDLRLAVIQSAKDLHGSNANEATEAAAVFDFIKIFDGQGTNTNTTVNENPGNEFVICTDDDNSRIYIIDALNGTFLDDNVPGQPISKISVTDDGQFAYFVDADNTIKEITIDYNSGTVNVGFLSDNPIWRNIAVSKDGFRFAALTDELEPVINVFDFSTGSQISQAFDLYNPTYTQGVSTGDVDFSDAMEFDITGELLMYDARNTIEQILSEGIEYWDIGFIEIWNSSQEQFAEGKIEKLFNGLPEGTSIGNPTFSKNSPNIVAFDLLDGSTGDYYILGANIETGENDVIYQNNTIGYPSYTIDDELVIFDTYGGNFGDKYLSLRAVDDTKITGIGDVIDYFENGKWGTIYGNGNRDLTTDTDDPEAALSVVVFPNPTYGKVQISFSSERKDDFYFKVYNTVGQKVYEEKQTLLSGFNLTQIDIANLPSGQYVLKIHSDTKTHTEIISLMNP